MSWDYGTPTYVREIEVKDEHIDIMGHTNNVVYVSWLEEAAWGHSQALGLNWEKYTELNRAMVAHRHEVDYLAATFCGDRLVMGTWIMENDKKLSLVRRYQLVRPADGVTVLRGYTKWVCVAIDSGKPKRMPAEFANGYIITAKE
ncbi:acyl-CoA thioesterase [Ketobacter sp. MCCC 1A13808]|uniref:acyl-CoA thioesterase n=1 Tax=Ketobacter sp. MCCC 1A13808 TaxID=2602738 RepID=UPI000F2DB97B|nr:thioesterase family protein [Ketobacter sp. MCCC 1A13808]MVF12760.1 acyl-CoA thioesterase [Ketobacter sp. MCCC 1A13808]RLP54046.1 MAG: acyl-CoA thioesterase [Ketobacter sp.]